MGTMYRLPPVCEVSDVIKTPACMYRMQNISQVDDASLNASEALPEELSALQRRQETILSRLEELRVLLSSAAGNLQSVTYGSQSVPSVSAHQANLKVCSPMTLAISASPSHPPTSLLVLLPWMKQEYGLTSTLSTHTHSSVTSQHLPDFTAPHSDFTAPHSDNAHIRIIITWKEVGPDPVLILSPIKHVAIRGEVNIARYLLGQVTDSTGHVLEATRLDDLLDAAHVISRGSDTDRRSSVTSLAVTLGQSSWTIGSTLSLADILLWNAVQHSGLARTLPSNLKLWFSNCSRQPVFQSAVKFFANQK
jgi:aminoacyl tRNA synthase complex-interacting multifunctional protein 2